VTLQTLSGRVLQNLTVAQLVKQHPAFYWTRISMPVHKIATGPYSQPV
jgi:hypothetical protein